jgi:hypothetical protein
MGTKSYHVLALVAAIACASAGTSSPGSVRNTNVITEQEIAASHESNAYDIISVLRPTYLKTRGHNTIHAAGSDFATVFMDGQQYGDLTSLRNIPAAQIHEIRYYSATDASNKFGMQAGGGAIDVRTK